MISNETRNLQSNNERRGKGGWRCPWHRIQGSQRHTGRRIFKRKAGFENGCLARGLHCELKIVSDNEPYDTFEQFLADHAPGGKMSLDGIFCVTDGLAYFIMKMLRRLGLDIPQDIQLIGYDGIRFFGDADYLCSTIVQPVPDIAELCVRLLLDKSIRKKPSLLCLPVTYAYGGTTREDA